MSNIHLIKTDKPSRLSILNSGKLNFGAEFISSSNSKPQHIYITNSEEIKEGDWYENNGVIFKADDVFDKGNNPNNSNPKVTDFNNKIILTTDPSLAPDVQKIDDEFLEWFVKNPSCEEVKVQCRYSFYAGKYLTHYKIIIPNEEPTAYHYLSCCRSIEECHCGKYPKQIKCYCGHTITCDCSPIDEPKQETLEKAAETNSEKHHYAFGQQSEFYQIGFIEGVKWQQERRYSEEEVRNLFRNYQYDSAQFAAIMEGDTDGKPTPTGWFEKFKKK